MSSITATSLTTHGLKRRDARGCRGLLAPLAGVWRLKRATDDSGGMRSRRHPRRSRPRSRSPLGQRVIQVLALILSRQSTWFTSMAARSPLTAEEFRR